MFTSAQGHKDTSTQSQQYMRTQVQKYTNTLKKQTISLVKCIQVETKI